MQEYSSNIQLAPLNKRFLAFLIDDFIVTILIAIIFWDNIAAISHDREAMLYFISKTIFTPLVLIKVIYQTFFVWYYEATLGKMALKIKVVNQDGSRINFQQSFLRASARVVSQMFLYLGFIIGFLNIQRKTLHDFLGRTIVVDAK